MKNKLSNIAFASVHGMWLFAISVIFILVLAVSGYVNYAYKVVFALPNIVLLLISVATVALAALVYIWQKKRIDSFFFKIPKYLIVVLTFALFAAQAYVFYNIFFKTGWDTGVLTGTALKIVEGVSEPIRDEYYLTYPNNLTLTWILTVLFRINELFGFSFTNAHLYTAILFQCVFCCVAGYMLFGMIKDTVKNPVAPYAAWMIFVFHVAFNPWMSITYSDAMALCLPIALLRLYQLTDNGRYIIPKWIAIGVLSYVGYCLKPQVLIVVIAILMIDAVRFVLDSDKKAMLKIGIRYGAALIAAVITMAALNQAVSKLPIELDENRAFGFTHIAMMGLNTESDGGYSFEDVTFSDSFDTAEERTAGNIQKIKERLKAFGVVGYIKHLSRKAMSIYGDGTYAWGEEGSFYLEIPDAPNERSAPLLRSFYYQDGDRYEEFSTFEQYLWIAILFGSVGVGLYCYRNKDKRYYILVAVLSLFGLVLFEMLFETRARYLYIYAPVFIFVSSLGWMEMVKLCRKHIVAVVSRIVNKNNRKMLNK